MPVNAGSGGFGHAAGMAVKPGVGEGVVLRQQNKTGCLLYSLANALVDGFFVVCLSLGDVGGNIRTGVLAVLLGDEFQHKGPGEDGLCFEGLDGPVIRHLAGDNAQQICLDSHGFQLVAGDDIDVQHRRLCGRDGEAVDAKMVAAEGVTAGQERKCQQSEDGADSAHGKSSLQENSAKIRKFSKSTRKIAEMDTLQSVCMKSIPLGRLKSGKKSVKCTKIL